ncbi:MAG: hypothetical protein IJR79_02195 [Clostridia bacterium]|nr:hypothetical protein [Clostridia bacterium]
MTQEDFLNALNNIDPELIESSAQKTVKIKKISTAKILTMAAAFVFIAAAAVTALKFGADNGNISFGINLKKPTSADEKNQSVSVYDDGNNAYAGGKSGETTTIYGGAVVPTEKSDAPSASKKNGSNVEDGSYSGGGEFESPVAKKAVEKGKGYTEKQLKDYIEKTKNTIAATIGAEYGSTENIKIYVKGYCHVKCAQENAVDLDFVTLPVTQNGRYVANVDIFNVDGVITSSISAGGDSWKIRDKLFATYGKDEIVFAYAGVACEAALMPDGTIYNLADGSEISFGGDTDWYSLLKTQHNTFSGADLENSENYVVPDDVPLPDLNGGKPKENASTKGENVNDKAVATTKKVSQVIFNADDVKKITIISEFKELMGGSAVSLSGARFKSFAENLAAMKLEQIPSPSDTLTGGGYIVTVTLSNGRTLRFNFLSEEMLMFDGAYFNDTSGKAEKIINDIINILA